MSMIAGVVGPSSLLNRRRILQRLTNHLTHRTPNDLISKTYGVGEFAFTIKGSAHYIGGEGAIAYATSSLAIDELKGLFGLFSENNFDKLAQTISKLRGGFIVVLWSAETKTLFLARDQIGLHPLYYCILNEHLIFASEPQAILNIEGIPREIDYSALAGSLALQVIDQSSTNYSALKRLPPAHFGIWNAGNIHVKRYWHPPVPGDLIVGSDHEIYAEAKSLFVGSVRNCIRNFENGAAMLSGGLDSSAIVATAVSLYRTESQETLDLSTFSAVFEGHDELCERRYQDAVIAQGGLKPAPVDCSILPQFSGVDAWLARHAGNVSPVGYAMYERVLQAAKTAGHKIILDGAGGDEVIGYGNTRPSYLFKQRKWSELAWEMLRSGNGSISPFVHFVDAFMRHGPPASKRLGKLARIYPRLFPIINQSNGPHLARRELLNKDFVATYRLSELEEVERQRRAAFKTEQEEHLSLVFNNLQTVAMEYVDRQIWAHEMEPRFPFWDLDLVEFCVKAPSHLKYKFGLGRLLTRVPMKGILPELVRLRTDKMDFTPFNRDGMLLEGLDRLQAQLDVIYVTLGDIFDVDVVKALFTRFTHGPDALWLGDVQNLFAVLTMGRFLIAERGGPKVSLGY